MELAAEVVIARVGMRVDVDEAHRTTPIRRSERAEDRERDAVVPAGSLALRWHYIGGGIDDGIGDGIGIGAEACKQ